MLLVLFASFRNYMQREIEDSCINSWRDRYLSRKSWSSRSIFIWWGMRFGSRGRRFVRNEECLVIQVSDYRKTPFFSFRGRTWTTVVNFQLNLVKWKKAKLLRSSLQPLTRILANKAKTLQHKITKALLRRALKKSKPQLFALQVWTSNLSPHPTKALRFERRNSQHTLTPESSNNTRALIFSHQRKQSHPLNLRRTSMMLKHLTNL